MKEKNNRLKNQRIPGQNNRKTFFTNSKNKNLLPETAEDEEFGFSPIYQRQPPLRGLYYNLPPSLDEPDLPPPPPPAPPAPTIPMHQYYDYQNINLKPTLPKSFKGNLF